LGATEVSPQYLVNCERRDSIGCQGGIIEHAVEHIQLYGYAVESDVPYIAKQ